jgi:hypothetical protein
MTIYIFKETIPTINKWSNVTCAANAGERLNVCRQAQGIVFPLTEIKSWTDDEQIVIVTRSKIPKFAVPGNQNCTAVSWFRF